MRFFQPIQQSGYARILAETRTHFPFSPGLISIEKPENINGFAAFFDMPFPPSYNTIEEDTNWLKWLIPEKKIERAHSTEFRLSIQPFYPPFVEDKFIESDYNSYLDKFLSLEDLEREIFTLPISQIENLRFEEVRKTECSLYVLVGLNSIINNQRRLTDVLVQVREKISPDIALYIPGPISPAYYSFLVYMGIDFFDNSLAYYTSKNGYFLAEEGVYKIDNHPDCFCSYCNSLEPNLFKHNETVLLNALAKTRFATYNGTLRTKVEKEIHDNVTFAAALKHIDTRYNEKFSLRTPIISSSPVKCIGEESFNRPIIKEYRTRISERYRPNSNSNLVVLFPCSAKKPYSFSRSHIMFRKAIRNSGKEIFNFLTELIITSPLSVVPRDLEDIYPSKHYDIPVAGQWSDREIDVTANLLSDVLSHFPKDTIIINHLHGQGYRDIVDIIKNKHNFDVKDTSKDSSPTSEKSLKALTNALKEFQENIQDKQIPKVSSKIRKLKAVADFEYGLGTGVLIFTDKIKIKGKYPRNQQIYLDKDQIASYISKTGFLSLFPKLANNILEKTNNVLEFGANYVSGSNIYAPGVIKANNKIHPNDEIFIVHEGAVIATATALVSGDDINKMTSGIVAEVKKKIKVKE